MKNIIKLVTSIVLGLFDAIFPKIENSIHKLESEFLNQDPKIKIDWIRFLVSILTFSFLVLNLFKIITVEDIIKIIEALNSTK